MYGGELKLDLLAVTELRVRLTLQGPQLEAQGVLKNRDGVGPPLAVGFRQTSNWPAVVVEKVVELVRVVEEATGTLLGPGGAIVEEPLWSPEGEEDIAGSVKPETLPGQL